MTVPEDLHPNRLQGKNFGNAWLSKASLLSFMRTNKKYYLRISEIFWNDNVWQQKKTRVLESVIVEMRSFTTCKNCIHSLIVRLMYRTAWMFNHWQKKYQKRKGMSRVWKKI